MWKFLGRMFTWLVNSKGVQKDRDIYVELKEHPELVPKSKKCAVRSMIFSLLTYVILIVAFAVIYLLWKYNTLNWIFNLVATIVITFGSLYILVACYIRSIINLIHQFRLNKRVHTWIALVMAIIPTLLTVVAVSFLATAKFG